LRFRIRPPLGSPAQALERTVEVDASRGTVTVGREAGADIELPFTTVSARHARLVRAADVWAVTDVGSANGTFVEGQRLRMSEPQVLRPGQVFRLADVELVFEGPPAGEADAAPETTATLARRLVSDLFGSSRPAEVARVVVVGGPDAGKAMRLAVMGQRYRVGRSPTCDLVLADDDVSREHAAFERRWDGVEVRDLGSKNGVERDGDRIEEAARLHDGETVVVGDTRLRLEDPEDRYLRQMQEDGEQRATAVVPTVGVSLDELASAPARSRPATGVGPMALAMVALAVLAGVGALALWLLVGSE
jgi:pSer/pThr/pTyr-binding forkhead associated (FHA) protein